jgi:hypothetical protein
MRVRDLCGAAGGIHCVFWFYERQLFARLRDCPSELDKTALKIDESTFLARDTATKPPNIPLTRPPISSKNTRQ